MNLDDRDEAADRAEALEGRLQGLAAENWRLHVELEKLRINAEAHRLWGDIEDEYLAELERLRGDAKASGERAVRYYRKKSAYRTALLEANLRRRAAEARVAELEVEAAEWVAGAPAPLTDEELLSCNAPRPLSADALEFLSELQHARRRT